LVIGKLDSSVVKGGLKKFSGLSANHNNHASSVRDTALIRIHIHISTWWFSEDYISL